MHARQVAILNFLQDSWGFLCDIYKVSWIILQIFNFDTHISTSWAYTANIHVGRLRNI